MKIQVPRLLLQPLVENAIRHGIAKRAKGGSIIIRATTSNGILSVQIRNEIPEPRLAEREVDKLASWVA